MPIYEYTCLDCGNISEYLMGAGGETTSVVCKNCGSTELKRIISTTAVSTHQRQPGHTCCGREERCSTPPCSTGTPCAR